MSLIPGTRVGAYEIAGKLGAGGIGEVYRARDGKLNRDIAIKVLPKLFASDPGRLARFTREAQTLAALNHPNIAHIHGFEESGDVKALVMELVEGDDLSSVPRRVRPTWQLAAAMAVIAGLAATAAWLAKPTVPTSITRLSIALPPGQQVTSPPAISPDGRLIAYAAGRTPASSQLYLRALDDFTARAVSSSAGAQYPVFSPDGNSVASLPVASCVEHRSPAAPPPTLRRRRRPGAARGTPKATSSTPPTSAPACGACRPTGGARSN